MITRLVSPSDAPEMAAVLTANRDFLQPWEPIRPEDYYTEEGQRTYLEGALHQVATGAAYPHVIIDDGRIRGRITLSAVSRGPFQSAGLGYWVAADANGRGLASAAVAEVARFAFGELRLHRIEAGTQLHNAASQRVLERNGFRRYGVAPRYLRINGEWRDHLLFQLLSDDD
ncbi:GNAT family N-acetyltransferase [Actinoplanes sp. NPDC026619]|uniref:GNAT family N-acetyltransferase n=1 Tax=Actinoplanes sp. NPDC026619 TaxID=3155798 RepID=UPI0033C4BA32